MKARNIASMCLLMVLGLSSAGNAVPAAKERPLVQVALLLDTSNSMDGLINQAKTQLWKVVNELLSAKRQGERPRIQVALYEYGKSSLPFAEGYLRQVVELTEDLDKVSEALFALTTNGGDEYCGQVIQRAVRELKWSDSSRDLKVIFIAGNEPFTQGPVDFREAVKEAIKKGVVVNTIHCGNRAEGVQGKWDEAARLADGHFMTIDQNQQLVEIAAPQDAEIERLNRELNSTFLPMGSEGQSRKKRQEKMDQAAMSAAPAAAAERTVYKAAASGAAAEWDLVEAEESGLVKLDDLKDEQLPDAMQKMTAEERKRYLQEQKKRRAEIKAKIAALAEERKKFIAEERKKQASRTEKTLDQALIETIRQLASGKGYAFDN